MSTKRRWLVLRCHSSLVLVAAKRPGLVCGLESHHRSSLHHQHQHFEMSQLVNLMHTYFMISALAFTRSSFDIVYFIRSDNPSGYMDM
mmetsp:Transcript_3405/g.7795  ORF Transcript_3405/g.7795 Transcript_3405/m.7795 type:complete len:88 (+) Transcript_3405:656-919(+)